MRKPTTLIHIIAGILAGLLLWLKPAAGISLLVAFGAFEAWQEHKIRDSGALDFWEFVLGLFIGAGIGLVIALIEYSKVAVP